MIADWPILSLTVWLPIIGGFMVLASGDREANATKWTALIIAILTFIVSLPLWFAFDSSTSSMQFVERVPWIPSFDVEYYMGIDGISMPLIILTTFITPLVVIAGWEVIKYRPSQYMAAFLIMEGVMVGVFSALDAMLFYVFWEAMLIPMFLIIGIWGGANRVYATIKFFLYTFLGSVFMLVALIYMYFQSGSFDILGYHTLKLDLTEQILIFIAFLLAFAVKVPMWPVHTWLPDAHVEAPTGGSVVLAAIMLKIGGYGFLRFSLPITPDASHTLDWLIIGMSLIAVVYIGFVALIQQDMKKLIAYSSIAHMGFVTLGFFIVFIISQNNAGSGAALGVQGGMVQMVSHGFISAALFLCVGVLYDRLHSREIKDYGGVVNTMPVFGAFMVFFAMANAGLPGTSGFVGEFMVILASFRADFWYAFLAATTLIIGAAYTLWMVKRVVFGDVTNEGVAALEDMNQREYIVLGTLAAAVLLLGLWPAPLVEVMDASVNNLLQHIAVSKL
ncbi:MAG: NADH-quinone oxidoreductase subunit M [Candidatus Thiodiazotropha sp. (ex Lucina aurantia)]|uniref:NADH-quinone oxidoreductase subunit M n=1 Tax=Candidatus Thiodiazotropha endolucinida TaxID=1655433 RepID=UPI00083F6080|nr:NADH-quinone oxidoreductase subunit M [Candidatus Thiodiazotropha endolucinida]MBT3010214.1 NADH-quinone oxidoreductase subunit M [Candidatus Thiodiazotropha sp. (ex Lucina pensylvanica)]MBT3014410.1 NADH-quinone oxidoreductase subunit M [Candidatus Thiodiazotropha taylori]MBT3038113.1 NADH-quinone oxidoreductase subunit M [Candidatus Thiodiazotropha sp. (ex Codakia orbicularis)]MBV2102293.1 NADH-quinone oxidoreductase subunit M [Candidatus Thiodiazotropha sp. (ex Lucina aurantia)]MBT302194